MHTDAAKHSMEDLHRYNSPIAALMISPEECFKLAIGRQ